MFDWTDRHCRYFLRQLTSQTLLYTEMVTTGAILHGKGDYLAYSEEENPLALQLGGSDPQALAQCAKLAEQRGYDEVNLNVGCPSDRVQNGRFRRLSDGRSGAGGRLHQGDERQYLNPDYGENSHRH
ncbi:tRNA-dihydrouridine synthase [Pectobacterium brasiliense]|uniref:tRNA-dihydrouridine synthase n=1 Tax=Pectobacterium brasiliense TaxID=180957 RepID=UPI0023DD75F0|nr:tRNA-dihydrouridine synthase [Pectobacterium brasiliense]